MSEVSRTNSEISNCPVIEINVSTDCRFKVISRLSSSGSIEAPNSSPRRFHSKLSVWRSLYCFIIGTFIVSFESGSPP
jgi:hypothetical protein